MRNLYKKIIKLFYFIIYGKIIIKKNNKLTDVKIHTIKIKKNIYKIFEIDDGRICTNTNDVAYINSKNEIINGPSIQLRKGNFATIKNNFTILNGTPHLCKYINGNVFSFLCGASGNINYFHWIFDVLPRLYIFNKLKKINKNDYILVPNYLNNFQKESLKLLNISNNILNAYNIKHIKAKKIYATFLDTSLITKSKIPGWVSLFIKKKFLNKQNIKKKFKGFKKIYIDRGDSNYNYLRSIKNETELKFLLKKKNFKFVTLSKLKFIDEINLFYNVKIIVGLFGAGLSNTVFSKKNTILIELKKAKSGNLYSHLAKTNKLKVYSINCPASSINKYSTRRFDGQIYCPINKLENVIKRIN